MNKLALPFAMSFVLLGACSPGNDNSEGATQATQADRPSASEAPEPAVAEENVSPTTLRLEGLGDLLIGEPVPAGSSWAVRGAQISDACQTASSPDYPGAYTMIVDDQVRRITISDDSSVTLIEGVGPGSTEAQVRDAFPGFVASPHKYVAEPGKYLTQPGSDPRLRFEIDTDGTVSLVHVGLMPQLAWVEGCA